MSRIYLIRHGKPASAWGGDDDDPGLDPIGLAQAREARDLLLALPADQRPLRVISSPLRRCRETAGPLAEALGVDLEIDGAVGEIPTPAGIAAEARGPWLRKAFEGSWREIEGDRDYEGWRREVAASLLPRGRTAVFSHFVAINAVVSQLLNDQRVAGFRPDHTSTTVLETDGRALTLISKGREAVTGVL
jgi:broad specificity phosphatase PhoE